MSANAVLADSITAHSVDLLSVEADVQRKIVAILSDLQRELVHDLTDSDPTGVARVAFRNQRLLGLLKSTRETIGNYLTQARDTSAGELGALAALESEYAAAAINQALRVDIVSVGLNKDVLEALVDNTLIEGAKHSDWWARQADDIRARFSDQMRLGVLRGEALGDLVRRIRGRQENKYADALLELPTRRASMLARTAVQNIANAARLKTYDDQAGLIKGIQWVATLDTRTCLARGERVLTPDGRRAIEGIEAGDIVIGGSGEPRKVIGTSQSRRRILVRIKLSNGEAVMCTPDHLWLTDQGWIEAQYLSDNSNLLDKMHI